MRRELKQSILAHRGRWVETNLPPNSFEALTDALSHGYGIETDIRDVGSQIVIEHDAFQPGTTTLEQLFDFAATNGCKGVLGLNIKADGLVDAVVEMLERFGLDRHFFFDMSIPETLRYLRRTGERTFLRYSDCEIPDATLVTRAGGLWIDCFEPGRDDVVADGLAYAQERGLPFCLVSPELHKREPEEYWTRFLPMVSDSKYICTDFPDRVWAALQD